MESTNPGDLPALPLALLAQGCSALQPWFTGQPWQDQFKQALDFTLVVFARFASCSEVCHTDVCCTVWSPVFTAVFY